MTGYSLVLNLAGPLSLRDTSGRDLTPRGRKAQGMLALLGTSPGMRRSRPWLQDKLWSDRGQEQGAASLRQCLMELRSVLGQHVDCLVTNGAVVALDPEVVTVRAHSSTAGEDVEFLEGIDIPDPEFEDWLRKKRLAWAERAASAPSEAAASERNLLGSDRPFLIAAPAEANGNDLRILASMIAESIALQIADDGNAQLVESLPGIGQPPLGLRLLVRASELGAATYFQIRLSDLGSGTVVWTGVKELKSGTPLDQAQHIFSSLTNEAVAIGLDELGRMGERGSEEERLALLGYQASRHTILLHQADQEATDRMLARAYGLHPLGIYLARRALLRHNQYVERTASSPEATRSEAVELVRHALADDPHNATVVAAAAKILLNLEGRGEGGFELATRATRLGPSNPLAWESLAVAQAHLGDWNGAYDTALRARDFASSLPQSYYWDMLCCMIGSVAGRYREAISYGERARDLAPTFKPPLRYLAALYHDAGRTEDARAELIALKALEPDFSVKQLADPDYPTASLRRSPLIAIAKSGLV